MKTVAFIFARGGSKGLPNKNLLPINGKPLIAWAIEQALAVERIESVVVSTDSVEIANVAKLFGADIPFMRPTELATDRSPEWLSWRHALTWFKEEKGHFPTCFVSIPTTSPLRKPSDIDRCLDVFEKVDCDAVATITESHRSPYFNMVRKDEMGRIKLVSKPNYQIFHRQEVPLTYDMTTLCYVAKPEFIMTAKSLFDGVIHGVTVPKERSIDIDTQIDFEICEYLLSRKQVNDAKH